MENKNLKKPSNVFKLGPPTVTTTTITSITSTSAIGGGNVTLSGATITARGVAWSTSLNPTTGSTKTTQTGGTGSFISSLTGLLPNTLYHVRAYATNSGGTSYGVDRTFTTLAALTSSEINSSNYNSFRRTGIGDGAAEVAFDAAFAAIAHTVDVETNNTPEEILKGNIK
jgi:hypothetical protein